MGFYKFHLRQLAKMKSWDNWSHIKKEYVIKKTIFKLPILNYQIKVIEKDSPSIRLLYGFIYLIGVWHYIRIILLVEMKLFFRNLSVACVITSTFLYLQLLKKIVELKIYFSCIPLKKWRAILISLHIKHLTKFFV